MYGVVCRAVVRAPWDRDVFDVAVGFSLAISQGAPCGAPETVSFRCAHRHQLADLHGDKTLDMHFLCTRSGIFICTCRRSGLGPYEKGSSPRRNVVLASAGVINEPWRYKKQKRNINVFGLRSTDTSSISHIICVSVLQGIIDSY